MLFGGANTRAETALTITIREPQRQPARALTLPVPVPPRTGLDQSTINRRSIGDVVVRAHIRCELRHHRLHLQLALRVRQQRLHHLRLFCSPRTRRQPRPQEWKGRGRDLSAWLVSSPGPFAAHLGSCAPPAAFSARSHAARAQRRVSAGWADGLQPESGRQAGAGAKGEGARRARSHPRAPPSVSASSPAPPSASPAQAMETFAIAGGGTQSAGGAPCGLGWRTSVPRSFVSSADCACSILSTSTMSCFTLRVATCHRQQRVARHGGQRGASQLMS